jgi:cytochrome c peroxidase
MALVSRIPQKSATPRRLRSLLVHAVAASSMLLAQQGLAHKNHTNHTNHTPHTNLIETPEDARQFGLESLRLAVQQDGGVPLPENLDEFVKSREAAVQLGKALFWDMQVGSDSVQACASCHFHAGADNRSRSQLNPGTLNFVDERYNDVVGYFIAGRVPDFSFQTKQPDQRLTPQDFPFVKSIQQFNRNANGTIGPASNNSNDIASSMGVFFMSFDGIEPGLATELGTPLQDLVFQADGSNVRRVEHRNSPSVINAVFNYANFWDGRANPHYNGKNAFGDQDQTAAILVNQPDTGLAFAQISLHNASLASQAMSPLPSNFEMAFGAPGNVRNLFEIGYKLLRPSSQSGVPLTPLGLQKVNRRDSVLGELSNAPYPGLDKTYEQMIQEAFADIFWDSTELLQGPNDISFTQMEANFSLFFGLAVMLYESTLVADHSPFDRWMETGRFNKGFREKELAGLNLFVNQGQCISCHSGPELTNASVRNAEDGSNAIRAMAMAQGTALYDNGFYNISVTPTTDDIGRGDFDPFGRPIAFARLSMFDRLGIINIPFTVIGNDTIPALDEDLGSAVCDDSNGNGVCERSEPIWPEFQRVAVDGAFKTPGLRNSELTGPYFHNGGMATLRQVVQFYNRGGNFCSFNQKDLDPTIAPLGLDERQEKQLVAFLVSLTDKRVKHQRAPFDHPELRIPESGLDTVGQRKIKAVGAHGSREGLEPFLDLDPNDPIYTPAGICSIEPL